MAREKHWLTIYKLSLGEKNKTKQCTAGPIWRISMPIPTLQRCGANVQIREEDSNNAWQKRHDKCWLCTEELLGKSRLIMITDLSDTKKTNITSLRWRHRSQVKRWTARLGMTGNPQERLQLTIPITLRSRRHLTNCLYLIVIFARFPVSLRATVNGCLHSKLSYGQAQGTRC